MNGTIPSKSRSLVPFAGLDRVQHSSSLVRPRHPAAFVGSTCTPPPAPTLSIVGLIHRPDKAFHPLSSHSGRRQLIDVSNHGISGVCPCRARASSQSRSSEARFLLPFLAGSPAPWERIPSSSRAGGSGHRGARLLWMDPSFRDEVERRVSAPAQ